MTTCNSAAKRENGWSSGCDENGYSENVVGQCWAGKRCKVTIYRLQGCRLPLGAAGVGWTVAADSGRGASKWPANHSAESGDGRASHLQASAAKGALRFVGNSFRF